MESAFSEFESFETKLSYSRCPPPETVHIGLVQLSTDHTLESDWSLLKNKQASVFSTRVPYSSDLSIKSLQKIASEISRASELIAVGLPMDVMAFGCTSASLVIGEKSISKLLTAKRGALPATNPWTAVKASFALLGAKKVAVFSPYPTEVNRLIYHNLKKEGYEVPVLTSLGIEHDTEITRVSRGVYERGP